jgi:hypothetical protein
MDKGSREAPAFGDVAKNALTRAQMITAHQLFEHQENRGGAD